MPSPPTIAPLAADAELELGIAELELGNAELELGNAELELGNAEFVVVISTWVVLVGFLENMQPGQCPQFLGKSGRFLFHDCLASRLRSDDATNRPVTPR